MRKQTENMDFSFKQMNLQELRKERHSSQQELASKLHVNQAEISKMERRTDMYVSTLQNYVNSLGGKLEIFAVFPDSSPVRIAQFFAVDTKPSHDLSVALKKLSQNESLKNTKTQTIEPENSNAQRRTELSNLWHWSINTDEARFGINQNSEKSKIEDNWYQKLLYQAV